MNTVHSDDSRLAESIARWTGGTNVVDTPITGLSLHRWDTPTDPTSYMLPPSICLIGQGRKRLFLADETYVYDAQRFLITSVELPVVTQIIEASSDRPYLGMTLELDLRAIADLMLGQNMPPIDLRKERLGIAISEVDAALRDAFDRLLNLLEHPCQRTKIFDPSSDKIPDPPSVDRDEAV